ncbi:MAG: RluA family pseudouridine synthase [Desulfovibrionales bacterium]
MPSVDHIAVTSQEAGQKLFQFLQRRLGPDFPTSAIMRWIRSGQVRIDGGRAKPFTRLAAGQVVRVPPYRPPETAAVLHELPETLHPRILYEDPTLLVVDKPSGLAVHPGTGHHATLMDWLGKRYRDVPWMPAPAHRIDQETSGLLVVAKSYERLRELQSHWKRGEVRKVYLAWVRGVDATYPTWTLLQDRMEKKAGQGGERVRIGTGKHALSWAKTLGGCGNERLLAVALVTGRTHQIRVQLASRGTPIQGDRKYGRGEEGSLFLHAWHLHWKDRSFTAPPPWPASLIPTDILHPERILADLPFELPSSGKD